MHRDKQGSLYLSPMRIEPLTFLPASTQSKDASEVRALLNAEHLIHIELTTIHETNPADFVVNAS